jgi:hypothetical protein
MNVSESGLALIDFGVAAVEGVVTAQFQLPGVELQTCQAKAEVVVWNNASTSAYVSSGSSPAVFRTSGYQPFSQRTELTGRQHLRPLRMHPIARGVQMKRFSLVAAMVILIAAISALAAPSAANVPAFPGILANARFVYVAAYDGDQFDPNLLPDDRNAIGAVQSAIQNWGKLTLVYQRSEADIIILVTSRPSEDVMAVYDAHQGSNGSFLWRVMGRDGLESGETPLVTQFEKGFESVEKHQ